MIRVPEVVGSVPAVAEFFAFLDTSVFKPGELDFDLIFALRDPGIRQFVGPPHEKTRRKDQHPVVAGRRRWYFYFTS